MFKVVKKTHYNNISNIFKVNNKDTRAVSGASLVNFEYMSHFSTVIIPEYKQTNVD